MMSVVSPHSIGFSSPLLQTGAWVCSRLVGCVFQLLRSVVSSLAPHSSLTVSFEETTGRQFFTLPRFWVVSLCLNYWCVRELPPPQAGCHNMRSKFRLFSESSSAGGPCFILLRTLKGSMSVILPALWNFPRSP